MINPFRDINWHPDERQVRDFGKTLLAGFSIVSILLLIVSFASSGTCSARFPIFIMLGGYLAYLTTIISAKMSLPIYWSLFFVSACIGTIVSNLLLILFFHMFFSPFAIILRVITGRDPLRLKKKSGLKSGWKDCEQKKDLKRYYRQY